MERTTLLNRHLKPLETRTGRLIGGTISKFLEDSKFFWTEYHSGRVNIILHVVSFSFLLYGLAIKSVALVLTGLFVFDEMGHAYNYFFVHNRDPKFGLRMIPYQLLYGSLGMAIFAQALPLVLRRLPSSASAQPQARHLFSTIPMKMEATELWKRYLY